VVHLRAGNWTRVIGNYKQLLINGEDKGL
jgi:hypothetical protein